MIKISKITIMMIPVFSKALFVSNLKENMNKPATKLNIKRNKL